MRLLSSFYLTIKSFSTALKTVECMTRSLLATLSYYFSS